MGVIKELLLNALIHRDYSYFSVDVPIHINIYKDRIQIKNPGYSMLPGNIIETNTKLPKNGLTKQINEILLDKDVPFHGFKAIRRASKLYNAPLPLLEDDHGFFTATIYKKEPTIYKEPYSIENIILYCKTPRSKLELYQHFFNTTKTDYGYFYKKYISRLVKIQVLFFTIPEKPYSKNQKLYSNKDSLSML